MKKFINIFLIFAVIVSLSAIFAGCGNSSSVSVTGVSLDKTAITMTVGGTQQLSATVTPENATDKKVTWTSDKESVATVSADGKVTAVAEGKAKITVQTADGQYKATCSVTVEAEEVAVSGITLNKDTAELIEGGTLLLRATVTPENATDKKVTWTSDKESVATVNADGKVTAIAVGVAKIKASCGEFSDECTITVSEKAVTGITVSKQPTKKIYKVGDVFDPAGVIIMANYNDTSKKDVTSDCEFTPNGPLTEADTEITVTYAGKFTAEISITVEPSDPSSALVATEAEFREALADGEVNTITVTADVLNLSAALSVDRDVTVNGNIKLGELSVAEDITLTCNGIVYGNDALTVSGGGKVIMNGSAENKAYISGTDVSISGIELTVNSVYSLTSLLDSSAIYATGSLTVTEGAVVETHSNIYARGMFRLDNGANLTVYGVGGEFDPETVPSEEKDMIGNALQSETSIEVFGTATRLTVYCDYETQVETAAISTTNGADITISEATVLVEKNAESGFAFGYGVWAGHSCWITNRAQVTFNVYRVGLGGASGSNADIVIEHKKEGEPLPEDDPLTKLTVTTVSEEGKLFELGGKSKGWIESVVTLNGVVQERTDGK